MRAKLPVYAENAPQEQALKINGLRAVFGEKYPPLVRVVSIGVPVAELLKNPSNPRWRQFSIEFCGGTHLTNAVDIGAFTIIAEESVSKGIRRIVALTGDAAIAARSVENEVYTQLSRIKHATDADLSSELQKLQKLTAEVTLPLRTRRIVQKEISTTQTTIKGLEKKSLAAHASTVDTVAVASQLLATAPNIGPGKLIIGEIPSATDDQLRSAIDSLKTKSPSYAILLAAATNEKVTFIAAVSDDLIAKGLKAGDWVKETAKIAGGSGGGRPNMAQAGAKDPTKLQGSPHCRGPAYAQKSN